MPDWQPVAVPDLCPSCGAYWECECSVVHDALAPNMRDFLYHRAAGAEDYASYLEGVRSGRLNAS